MEALSPGGRACDKESLLAFWLSVENFKNTSQDISRVTPALSHTRIHKHAGTLMSLHTLPAWHSSAGGKHTHLVTFSRASASSLTERVEVEGSRHAPHREPSGASDGSSGTLAPRPRHRGLVPSPISASLTPEIARVTPSREFIEVLDCGEHLQRQSRCWCGWGPGQGPLLLAASGTRGEHQGRLLVPTKALLGNPSLCPPSAKWGSTGGPLFVPMMRTGRSLDIHYKS